MAPHVVAEPLHEASNVQVKILSNCGHMMLTEQPEQVHQALVTTLTFK